jgi:phage shock protein A
VDKIDSVLENLVTKVNSLESRVRVLEESSSEFKDSLSFVSNKVDEFEKKHQLLPKSDMNWRGKKKCRKICAGAWRT